LSRAIRRINRRKVLGGEDSKVLKTSEFGRFGHGWEWRGDACWRTKGWLETEGKKSWSSLHSGSVWGAGWFESSVHLSPTTRVESPMQFYIHITQAYAETHLHKALCNSGYCRFWPGQFVRACNSAHRAALLHLRPCSPSSAPDRDPFLFLAASKPLRV
jgi:hypothetical protein